MRDFLPTLVLLSCGVTLILFALWWRPSAAGGGALPPACPDCGHRNPTGAVFCARCGRTLPG
ncbi:MAG: zinc ribbon domain-containing protein [Phycisphaerales bacterium]|nr:zinc ribbon domain-containing protein [Phycisphaerales bacterium]